MDATTIIFRTAGLSAAIALMLLSPPTVAQQMDHSKMPMPMPVPVPVPVAKPISPPVAVKAHASQVDHAAMGHDMRALPDAPAQPMDHSTMDHSTMDHGAAETKTGTEPSVQPMDHAAMGHDMRALPSAPARPMDHSTMDHSAMGHAGMAMPLAAPRGPIPRLTDADRAAAFPPVAAHVMGDNSIHDYVLLDRLEVWNADPGSAIAWEGTAWIGTDLNRVWLRSEGERVDGRLESADVEVLYGRSVARWWDVVAGIRHDFKPGASQDFAVLGVIGLTPYKFELAATAYLGQSGQTAARLEVEYETLLTNRLILQPLVEINVFGQDDERRGIGAGLGTMEAGLRLRYEFSRQFAPYIGLVRERAFGRSADLRRLDGEDIDETRVVAGIHLWF